jgi:integrase
VRKHRVSQSKEWIALDGGWRNEPDLVYCYDDGRYIEPLVLGLHCVRCLDRMGIEGSFHGLRHTHVSLPIMAGLPINVISARVGHANRALRTTFMHTYCRA